MKIADTWCWQRRIATADEDAWVERLSDTTWTMAGRPGAVRPLLCAYFRTPREAENWRKGWGGQIRRVRVAEWLDQRPSPPLRIGRRLEILSAPTHPTKSGPPRLVIPHGLAFGSGEHATTAMLLHALARRADLALSQERVLDLGTGSGILALAARALGARRIVATDFDPAAIRTARENEARNFPGHPLIRWQRADVMRLGSRPRYDLVVANLFSGILIEAAGRVAAAVAPGGTLWLSGILREQERSVVAAYRRRNLHLVRAARRGKWVLLEWKKSPRSLQGAEGVSGSRR